MGEMANPPPHSFRSIWIGSPSIPLLYSSPIKGISSRLLCKDTNHSCSLCLLNSHYSKEKEIQGLILANRLKPFTVFASPYYTFIFKLLSHKTDLSVQVSTPHQSSSWLTCLFALGRHLDMTPQFALHLIYGVCLCIRQKAVCLCKWMLEMHKEKRDEGKI